VTVIGWGALLGGVHWWRKRRLRAAVLLAALVVSHWVLDFVTHRPDLPLAPWSDVKVGLGLWNYPALAFAAEAALLFGGMWLNFRAGAARRAATVAFGWACSACRRRCSSAHRPLRTGRPRARLSPPTPS